MKVTMTYCFDMFISSNSIQYLIGFLSAKIYTFHESGRSTPVPAELDISMSSGSN